MITSFRNLPKIRKNHKDKKIVFAGGVFDLIHLGHIQYFRSLKRMGDIVIIAVSNDLRVKERKGSLRPILSQQERLAIINSIKYIDYVLVAPQWNSPTPPTKKIVLTLRPDFFVSPDNRWLKDAKLFQENGTKLKIVSGHKVNSTTDIIETIVSRYVTANTERRKSIKHSREPMVHLIRKLR